jgi:hypothetical protein
MCESQDSALSQRRKMPLANVNPSAFQTLATFMAVHKTRSVIVTSRPWFFMNADQLAITLLAIS